MARVGPSRSILWKGLALLAIPLLFQVAFVAMILWIRHENHRATELTYRSMEVVRHADAPLRSLSEVQGQLRAFLLSRDEDFTEAVEAGLEGIGRELDDLRRIVREPGQLRALDRLGRRYQAYRAWITRTALQAEAGDWDGAMARFLNPSARGPLEAFRDALEQFRRDEERLVADQLVVLEASWRRLDRLTIVGLVLLVGSTGCLGYLSGRAIAARVGTLIENIRRLGAGRELVPELSGDDEFAQLDRAFRGMAQTLGDAAERERAYRAILERRAEQLDVLNRELAQKSHENELFVYSVSHDLRSPLVNLQGFSRELGVIGQELRELLDRPEVPGAIREQARSLIETDMGESLHYIQQAVGRLGAIIDALLRLSRAGRVEYQPRQVDVASIVARIQDALQGSLAEHRAWLKVGPLPEAWGDPTAIEQVFANLMINAVTYLDPDRPGHIEVGDAGSNERESVYYIRDNGLGIPEAYQEKVFAAFQRIHRDVAPGEGIGLTLVRRVVDRLHGRIWVESQEGAGSTFFVALPATAPETADAPPAPADAAPGDRPLEPAAELAPETALPPQGTTV